MRKNKHWKIWVVPKKVFGPQWHWPITKHNFNCLVIIQWCVWSLICYCLFASILMSFDKKWYQPWNIKFLNNKKELKHIHKSSYLGPWVRSARSFVILPDSTVSIHADSSFCVKSSSLSFLSSFALNRQIYTVTMSPLSRYNIFKTREKKKQVHEQMNKHIQNVKLILYSNKTYLCSSPRVQAKIEAILLVLVSCPFWCSLKCLVTVPWAASASNVFPSEDNCRKEAAI